MLGEWKEDRVLSATQLKSGLPLLPWTAWVDATGATDGAAACVIGAADGDRDGDGAAAKCFLAEPATADPFTNAFITSSLLIRPCFWLPEVSR